MSNNQCMCVASCDLQVESTSAQIILPQKWFKRRHDIYISMISHDHRVCPKASACHISWERARTHGFLFFFAASCTCNHRVPKRTLWQGLAIAIVSTTVETADPLRELEPAIRLLGEPILQRFDSISDVREPVR